MPLTPIAEARDEVKWAAEMFPMFKQSCESSQTCQDQGWSVLLRGVQATIGDVDNAMSEALQLPSDVFVSAGGNGHSLTNTLWWISTRPYVSIQLDDDGGDTGESDDSSEVEDGNGDCNECSHEVCASELNKCPLWDAPFLCVKGPSIGGCSPVPWALGEDFCKSCCRLVPGC